jgi:hypothetical protein
LLLLSGKKNTNGLTDGKSVQKKNSPLELYRRTYSICISTGKSPTTSPSVIVAWAVNISELSVKYQWIQYVGIVNGKSPTTSFRQ